MFSSLKKAFKKVTEAFSAGVSSLFSGKTTIDEDTLKALETQLIQADTGVKTTRVIIEKLREHWKTHAGSDTTPHEALMAVLHTVLTAAPVLNTDKTRVYLMVGINGTGKTTFVGKLAHKLKQEGKRVLLVAADTFRAAAPEQLAVWAERGGAALEQGKPGQDPGSVAFAGCQKLVNGEYDVAIIDTAGRMHTSTNLMSELAKVRRVVAKLIPDEQVTTLVTIDSMLGQSSLEQARLFKDSAHAQGVVLSKTDGTGKGGMVFAIAHDLQLPVTYISYGEGIEHMALFDPQDYVNNVVSNPDAD